MTRPSSTRIALQGRLRPFLVLTVVFVVVSLVQQGENPYLASKLTRTTVKANVSVSERHHPTIPTGGSFDSGLDSGENSHVQDSPVAQPELVLSDTLDSKPDTMAAAAQASLLLDPAFVAPSLMLVNQTEQDAGTASLVDPTNLAENGTETKSDAVQQYIIQWEGLRAMDLVINRFWYGNLFCEAIDQLRREHGDGELPVLVNMTFGCLELFQHSTSGTGNYISLFYAIRLAGCPIL
jgi:hypothetical protein